MRKNSVPVFHPGAAKSLFRAIMHVAPGGVGRAVLLEKRGNLLVFPKCFGWE